MILSFFTNLFKNNSQKTAEPVMPQLFANLLHGGKWLLPPVGECTGVAFQGIEKYDQIPIEEDSDGSRYAIHPKTGNKHIIVWA